jgi:hypothetical protein
MKHECSGQIIRAHSLSKRQSLGAVTENGHVFSAIPNTERLFHRDDARGQLIGINKASTFTGFCGKHDQEIFRELDTKEFDGNASNKTFLVAYGTLCRELFAKRGHSKTFEVIKELDRGRSESDQIFIQKASSLGAAGAQAALAELQELKGRFDNALLAARYNEFCFRNFRFDVRPDIVSAGGFNPTHNLGGRLIQDLIRLDQPSENLLFSILPATSGFWVSFLWSTEHKLMGTFVEDFARMATVGTAYGVALAYVENSFMKPSVWRTMGARDQEIITKLTLMGTVNDDYSRLPEALRFLANRYPITPTEDVGAS